MQITNEEMKFLLKSQQGELDAVLMYKALANKVKREKEAEAFRQLAADEGRHAAVLKQITKTVLKPRKIWLASCPSFIPFWDEKDSIGSLLKGNMPQ